MSVQSSMTLAALSLLLASVLSMPATAQQTAPPTTGSSPAGAATLRWEGLTVTAIKGQTQEQLAKDRYECHRWAVSQTGFDPTQPGGGVAPSANPSRRRDYGRAMTACLKARGYAVRAAPPPYRYAPSPATPPPYYPPPPYGQPVPIRHYTAPAPAPTNPAVTGQVEAGVSFVTGNTSNYLNDGVNFGLGVTWFPNPAGPLALRLDGNYNWFDGGNRGFYRYGYGDYGRGNEQLYGGDIDLEVDLDHRYGSRMYLLGGLGEYRATANIGQGPYGGLGCGYVCGPYYFAGGQTTDWHGAWNAGLGWEWSVGPSDFFFVEARYMQLIPSDMRLQFVPVRVGFRF